MLSDDDLASVSPALERYRREALEASLWKRPQLSPRDRSIVTIAALIARNQTAEQAHYLALALDNGVRPSEISEIITHLAFYAGWGNAMATVQIAQGVFDARGVSRSALPPAPGAAAAARSGCRGATRRPGRSDRGPCCAGPRGVHQRRPIQGPVASAGACAERSQSRDRQRTDRVRPGRTGDVSPQPRDGQRPDQEEAGEVITHLAFYAGWPNAFSAVPVAKDVFDKRPR